MQSCFIFEVEGQSILNLCLIQTIMTSTPTQIKTASTQNSTPTQTGAGTEPPAKKQKCLGFQSVEDIQRILECPVCFNTPGNPDQIHFCSNGHMLCDDCHKKILEKKCPTCRSDNWTGHHTLLPLMKKILSALPKQCPFTECEKQLKDSERDEHMKNCEYRLFDCIGLKSCSKKVTFDLASVQKHLEDHNIRYNLSKVEAVELGHLKRFYMKLDRDYESYFDNTSVGCTLYPNFFKVDNRIFIARSSHAKNLYSFQVFLHGNPEDAKKYLYDVKVTNLDDPQYNVSFSGNIISVDDDNQAREIHPGTFSFTKAFARTLVHDNGKRISYDVTIKKKNI